MPKKIAIILLFSASLFAYNTQGTIYTWGYGELIKDILDAIAMLVQNKGLNTIFKTAMAIAFLIFAFRKAVDSRTNPAIEFGKMMLLGVAVWYLFLNAKNDDRHRYAIYDATTGQQFVVNGVPTGIGETLSLITLLEYKIADKMETYFSLPDSIKYRNSGIGFPLQDHYVVSRLNDSDIYFQRTFNDFIANCTIYEIEEGSKDLTYLMTASDTFSALNPNGDTRLTKYYSSSDPDGTVMSCQETYNKMNNDLPSKITNLEKLAATLLNLKGNLSIFRDRNKATADFFFNGVYNSSQDYVKQGWIAYLTSQSFSNLAKKTGLSEAQIAYSKSIADLSKESNFITSGLLAKEYLPIMKGVLLAIIIGVSWIIALMAVMMTDFRYIKLYFILLLWIMMWTPILVVINYIADYNASLVTTNLGSGYSLFTAPFITKKASTTLAWLGYLVWLTPILAFSIVKASEHGFSLMITSLSGALSGASAQGAGRVVSEGDMPKVKSQIRMHDTVYSYEAGATKAIAYSSYGGHTIEQMMTDTGSGTTANYSFDNGSSQITATEGSVTNARFQGAVNLANQQLHSASEDYNKAVSNEKSLSHRYGETFSGATEKALSEGKGINISFSDSLSKSEQESITKSFSEAGQKVFRNTKSAQEVTEIRKILQGNLGAGADIGISIKKAGDGVNAKAGVDANAGVQYSLMVDGREAYTFQDTEEGALTRAKQFAQVFSESLSHNENLAQTLNRSIQSVDSQRYSELRSIARDLTEAHREVEASSIQLRNAEQFSRTISNNGLVVLADKMVEDYEKKYGMGWQEATKAVGVELTDMFRSGDYHKIDSLLRKYNIYDEVEQNIPKVNEFSNTIWTNAKQNIEGDISGIKSNIEAGQRNIEKQTDIDPNKIGSDLRGEYLSDTKGGYDVNIGNVHQPNTSKIDSMVERGRHYVHITGLFGDEFMSEASYTGKYFKNKISDILGIGDNRSPNSPEFVDAYANTTIPTNSFGLDSIKDIDMSKIEDKPISFNENNMRSSVENNYNSLYSTNQSLNHKELLSDVMKRAEKEKEDVTINSPNRNINVADGVAHRQNIVDKQVNIANNFNNMDKFEAFRKDNKSRMDISIDDIKIGGAKSENTKEEIDLEKNIRNEYKQRPSDMIKSKRQKDIN